MLEITSLEKADLKGDAVSSRHTQVPFIYVRPATMERVPHDPWEISRVGPGKKSLTYIEQINKNLENMHWLDCKGIKPNTMEYNKGPA